MQASGGTTIRGDSLPFLRGWTLADRQGRLDAIGWNRDNQKIPGLSSN